MNFLFLVLAIHGVYGSPLSLMECGCPAACNVHLLNPSCDQPITVNSTSFNNSNIDWMGAVEFVSLPSNMTVAATGNVDCSSSFATIWNNSMQLAQRGLVQTSTSSCEALVLPNETANANVTMFIGIKHLGGTQATLARLPPNGKTLYSVAAPSVSLDGAHVLVFLTSLVSTFGCCPPLGTLNVDVLMGGVPCISTTGALVPTTNAEYSLATIPTSCAFLSYNSSGNTVYNFNISITSAASCAGNTLLSNPGPFTGIQQVALPGAFSTTVSSYGYSSNGCPFTESAFTNPFVYVDAVCTFVSVAPVAPTTSVTATFNGFPATADAPVILSPTPSSRVFRWKIYPPNCFATGTPATCGQHPYCLATTPTFACGAQPVFAASVSSEFDFLVHRGTDSYVFGSTCNAPSNPQQCVLNNTAQCGVSLFTFARFVDLFHYDPAQSIVLTTTFSPPDYRLTLVVDTVIAQWTPFSAHAVPQNYTFSNSIETANFCRYQCNPATCSDSFHFSPADFGIGAFTGGAVEGQWYFWISTELRDCSGPQTPAVYPTNPFYSTSDIKPLTAGCTPIGLAAVQTVSIRPLAQNDVNVNFAIAVSMSAVAGLVGLILAVSIVTSRSSAAKTQRFAPRPDAAEEEEKTG